MSSEERSDCAACLQTPFNGLCVGCGVCAVACPHGAIVMRRSRAGIAVPSVDAARCTGCGACGMACPQDSGRLRALAEDVSGRPDPRRAGLDGAEAFLAWDEGDGRRRSASGGVATALALRLLADGDVSGVLHVKRIMAKRGMPHYAATISATAEEIDEGRGSAYESIDFSPALARLEPGLRYLVIGTPCFIRGVKRLVSVSPRLKGVRLVTCALVCSHNVTSRFADFLADANGVLSSSAFKLDPRDKTGIAGASEYNTRFTTEDGTDIVVGRKTSGWTRFWRNHYFALKACCYCSDFWGAEADVSVKDAWGRKEWTVDPLGRSIVLLRAPELRAVLVAGGLRLEPIRIEDVADMQPQETYYKLACASDKFRFAAWRKPNRRNGLFWRMVMATASEKCYNLIGFRCAAAILRTIETFLGRRKPKYVKAVRP